MCSRCLRPQRACICRWIAPVNNIADVLILQHPLETREAKGSARLLHLSLAHGRLEIGESFDEQALRALLHAPLACGAVPHPVLLYPADDSAPAGPIDIPDDPSLVRLVVVDGTWRKTSKMLHLNPQLRALPRMPLVDPPASHYQIRKARRADQLSTLEAVCHALAQIEHDSMRYEPLLQAFDGFVAQQEDWRATAHAAMRHHDDS